MIIDTCIFREFFQGLFCPIAFKSLGNPRGPKIVVGGTKYKNEVSENGLSILSEYSKLNKVIYLQDEDVDNLEKDYKVHINSSFDDPHIAAMVHVSKCRIIVTKDHRMRSLKSFFSSNSKPILYTQDESCSEHLFNKEYRISI